MKESIGKAGCREYFFADTLLDWLSPEQIEQGNFLLLLGHPPRELAYTDALGLARSHIFSVERKERMYLNQLEDQLGANIYFGELTAYLESLLDGTQDFLVLNLDVEGSYHSQIDPSMTPIFLLCWRSPETVIATYSSVGRDTETLWEGIRSLAIFLRLEKEQTLKTLAVLAYRYAELGCGEPVNMALRDFFWLRSQFEHALMASVLMGDTVREAAQAWFDGGEALWQAVVRFRRRPLRLTSLVEIVDLAAAAESVSPEIVALPALGLGIEIGDLRHVLYDSNCRGLYQLGYFTRLRVLQQTTDQREWAKSLLDKFTHTPLTYFDRRGARHVAGLSIAEPELLKETIISRDRGLYDSFKPRVLHPAASSSRLIGVCQAAIAARKEKEMAKRKRSGLVENGNLSAEGKALVQLAARKWPGETTAEIMRRLPAEISGTISEGVLRAHVAVGRRK